MRALARPGWWVELCVCACFLDLGVAQRVGPFGARRAMTTSAWRRRPSVCRAWPPWRGMCVGVGHRRCARHVLQGRRSPAARGGAQGRAMRSVARPLARCPGAARSALAVALCHGSFSGVWSGPAPPGWRPRCRRPRARGAIVAALAGLRGVGLTFDGARISADDPFASSFVPRGGRSAPPRLRRKYSRRGPCTVWQPPKSC